MLTINRCRVSCDKCGKTLDFKHAALSEEGLVEAITLKGWIILTPDFKDEGAGIGPSLFFCGVKCFRSKQQEPEKPISRPLTVPLQVEQPAADKVELIDIGGSQPVHLLEPDDKAIKSKCGLTWEHLSLGLTRFGGVAEVDCTHCQAKLQVPVIEGTDTGVSGVHLHDLESKAVVRSRCGLVFHWAKHSARMGTRDEIGCEYCRELLAADDKMHEQEDGE